MTSARGLGFRYLRLAVRDDDADWRACDVTQEHAEAPDRFDCPCKESTGRSRAGPARKTRALAAGSMRYRCVGIPPAKSGQAEVGQHGPAVQGQQDIVRLDFEVKDDGDVCGPQRA